MSYNKLLNNLIRISAMYNKTITLSYGVFVPVPAPGTRSIDDDKAADADIIRNGARNLLRCSQVKS